MIINNNDPAIMTHYTRLGGLRKSEKIRKI